MHRPSQSQLEDGAEHSNLQLPIGSDSKSLGDKCMGHFTTAISLSGPKAKLTADCQECFLPQPQHHLHSVRGLQRAVSCRKAAGSRLGWSVSLHTVSLAVLLLTGASVLAWLKNGNKSSPVQLFKASYGSSDWRRGDINELGAAAGAEGMRVLPAVMTAECASKRTLSSCGRTEAIVIATGSLQHRIEAVCAAQALGTLHGQPMRTLWVTQAAAAATAEAAEATAAGEQCDRVKDFLIGGLSSASEPCTAARFEDLFDASLRMDVQSNADEFLPMDHNLTVHRLRFPICPVHLPEVPWDRAIQRGDPKAKLYSSQVKKQARAYLGEGDLDAHLFYDIRLLATTNTSMPRFESVTSRCQFQQLLHHCYATLRPSAAVRAMMEREEEAGRIASSTAVYMEPMPSRTDSNHPRYPCAGCRPAELLNCTARRIARRYMREPGADFIIASRWPSDASLLAGMFHNLRQPLLLNVTRQRLMSCPAPQDTKPLREGPTQKSLGVKQPWLGWRRGEKVESRYALQEEEEPREPQDGDRADERGRGGDEEEGKQRGLWLRLEKRREAEARGREGGGGGERERERGVLCEQLQVAELFLLSLSPSFFHLYRSPASDFIRTRVHAHTTSHSPSYKHPPLHASRSHSSPHSLMSGSSEGGLSEGGLSEEQVSEDMRGAEEMSVCDAPPEAPLLQKRFTHVMVVDERLKTLYCAQPKVACTSWKLWFQKQRGINNTNITESSVHDVGINGLDELWFSYTESQAIQLLTRPDLFKFTFVRNPFSRLASVYLDKHVSWKDPKERRKWNRRFFRSLPSLPSLTSAQQDFNLTFPSFVRLTLETLQTRRASMNPHIAPQADICGLSEIKYDFVGHIEDLGRGVAHVMNKLHAKKLDSFTLGKAAHPTAANMVLHELYDSKGICGNARQLYESDFSVPLNNVTYGAPRGLEACIY